MSKLDRTRDRSPTRLRRPFDGAAIAGVLGVDGAPVRLVGYRNVVAAVSTAVPADLDEEALSARLERLEELELIARAHHSVVDAVGVHAVTLPFRLATIHLGDAGVVDMLRRNYTAPRLQARATLRTRSSLASRCTSTPSQASPRPQAGRRARRRGGGGNNRARLSAASQAAAALDARTLGSAPPRQPPSPTPS